MVTTYNYNDPSIVYGGYWVTNTYVSVASWDSSGYSDDMQFTATGTDLTLRVISGSVSPLSIYVDGGTATTPTLTVNTWTTLSVFTGLSDAPHTVVIKAQGVVSFYVAQAACLSLTGSAPAMAVPAGLTGPNQVINANAAKLSKTGGFQVNATTGNNVTPWMFGVKANNIPFCDACVGIYAKCTGILVWSNFYGSAEKISLTIDSGAEGADFAPTPITPGTYNEWGWYTLASGLDGTAFHEYRFRSREGAANDYLYSFMCLGGDGNGITTHSWTDPTSIYAFYGDSITQGIEAAMGTGGSRWNFPWLVSQTMGVQCLNAGIRGAQTYGAAAPAGEIRFADVTAYGSALTNIFILYGTNDLGHSVTEANFKTAYTVMLNGIDTALQSSIGATWYTTCKVWCLAILFRGDSFDTGPPSRATFNADLVAAVGLTTNPSRFTLVDSSGWLISSDMSSSDPHPKPATSATPPFGSVGAGKIASGILALLGPTTATVSGPASGPVSAESTAFTVTLNVVALSGGQVVSLASTGTGDVFHATSGGGSVSSITVASGQTVGTFYLVPGTAGARTITPTSSGITFTPTTLGYTGNSGAALAAGTVTVTVFSSTSLHAATAAATGSTPPYSYQFRRAPDASGSPGTFANDGTAGAAQAITDTGLTASTTYWYDAVATDAALASATSSPVSATTSATPSGVIPKLPWFPGLCRCRRGR